MTSSSDLPPLNQFYLRRWLGGQFTKPVPPAKDLDLSGQTGILVGGTDGIGLACARVLLEYKLSTLILAARNMQKGRKVATSLREQFPSADVQVWELEMSSYDSVQNFSKRCTDLKRIDFAILGAGVLPAEFKLSPSTRHELTLQVHYLSTALLALLLLPLLKGKHPPEKPAHLTIVSSDFAHLAELKERGSDPLLPAFDKPIPWGMNVATERYNCCKVLLLMLVLKLKGIVDPADVIVNSVCPGMSKPTGNEREYSWIVRSLLHTWRRVMGRSLKASAWVYTNAALEQGPESHGSFLTSWQIAPFPELMYTEEGRSIMESLWAETLNECDFAGVKDIAKTMSSRN